MVNNIENSQKLFGCTIIEGDLNLQVKGGENIIMELEKNLGSIEEIRGILRITRSFPLLSLSFFKSLRNITGNIDGVHSTDSEYVFDQLSTRHTTF